MATVRLLAVILLLGLAWSLLDCDGHVHAGGTFDLDIHHRFSDDVRSWVEQMMNSSGGAYEWPEKGSLYYYNYMASRDRGLLHRRGLAENDDGASTFTFDNGGVEPSFIPPDVLDALNALHYAAVSFGTPKVTYWTALDSSSDLSWVPCNCDSCVPDNTAVYRSNASSTNQIVPCSSPWCSNKVACSTPSDSCPYSYVDIFTNDLNSGVLVEDVLHLTTPSSSSSSSVRKEEVKAKVFFGCSSTYEMAFQKQYPQGLFGIGIGNKSIPSKLASSGIITSDSFSLCLGSNERKGRIKFGDKGSSDQRETPFNIKSAAPSNRAEYAVTVTAVKVDKLSIQTQSFKAFLLTEFSFSTFKDPLYTNLTKAINSSITEDRYDRYDTYPLNLFEYCYRLSPNKSSLDQVPEISLTMDGGSTFVVQKAFVNIAVTTNIGVDNVSCLAILKNTQVNVIGGNFMDGLKLVFDRERSVFGWQEFNCSSDTTLPSGGGPASPTSFLKTFICGMFLLMIHLLLN